MEEEAKVTKDPKPLRILKHEALHTLTHVVLLFSFVTQLLGFVFIEIYLVCSPSYLEALRQRNMNHVFFAFSTSVGQFTNSGIVFLNDEFTAFRYCSPILLCVGLQAVIGNTLFAPSIRAILWILHRVSSARKRLAYEYLLNYPRKCYTHLFTSKQTIWLIATVLSFTALQTAFFLALEWKSKVFQGVATKDKILGGFFQCVTARNAGGTTLNMAEVSQAMLVLYTAMMYMAVYPIYLTRESGRVRSGEESEMIKLSDHCSCNYYSKRRDHQSELDAKASELISLQFRKLLARDSAYLFVAIFTICIVESWNINHDPLNYSIFNIFFEVISAYGNIGLSVGYNCKLKLQLDTHASSGVCEDSTCSFSGKWSTSGKLLLMIVMILGRIRGLPDEADEASRLPWNDATLVQSSYTPTYRSDDRNLDPISLCTIDILSPISCMKSRTTSTLKPAATDHDDLD